MERPPTPSPVPPRRGPQATGDTGDTGGQPLVTVDLLIVADGANGADYYQSIVAPMRRYADAYSVNTTLRLAHFLAQVGHESGFRATEENGRYSAQRMREVFGCKGGQAGYDKGADDCRLGPDGKPARLRAKLWTAEATYANNARNLLGYVYASRLGNGDEVSGDGYRYRGRGFIQLTGKANYRSFTDCHNERSPADRQDFVVQPDLLLSELRHALESAFYFWDVRDINRIADTDSLADVTFAVNGGDNGMEDRAARLARIKKALGV